MIGKFITFEGVEGSGKSTQIQNLKTHLESKGYQVYVTKEPGGTALGEQIRSWLLDPNTEFKHAFTELLLFYVDRFEHVASVVLPKLRSGVHVLCDRYVDSTFAYQIGGRKMPEDLIGLLNQHVGLMPDLTLLFDLDIETALQRVQKRGTMDRFEVEGLAFHARIRQAYLDLAKRYPDRIYKMNVAGKSVEDIFLMYCEKVAGIIGETPCE